MPFATAIKATEHAPARLCGAVRQGSAKRHRHGSDPRRRPHARRRSAGRRVVAVLGADQRRATGSTSPSSITTIDPTFAFMTVDHDGKIRMDCSSPYAMAQPRRAEGPLPGRLRQRPRCGPARHRDAVRRADESQSLPGGGDPLSAHAPAGVAAARCGRQDAGEQQPHRSRGRNAWPPTVRGAGRLQMVRPRPVRRLVLLRRRGKRRRQLSAARRHRVDDRQRRSDHGPARRRDHRAHRQGSR